jgi:uncharacterized protein
MQEISDPMETAATVAALLRDARRSAGLTQAALAERAGTSQAVVARIETRVSQPDLSTLSRLLLAAGRTLTLTTTPIGTEELRQLDESLMLTPRQRVERNRRQTALAAQAARAPRRPLRPHT